MAAVDPYAPCPCGSGEKFKWCCHKIEPIAVRAERLYEGHQIDAAIAALDEGLRKAPDNPWLLIRKAMYEHESRKGHDPRPTLERIFAKKPGHIQAHGFNVLLHLQLDGLASAIKALQRALTAASPEDRPKLAWHIQIVGELLAQAEFYPAAIEHLSLALDWYEGDDLSVSRMLEQVLRDRNGSPWARTIHELSPPPHGLPRAVHDRFEKAIAWSGEGLWQAASSAFSAIAASGVPEAERNYGLCRLWLADEEEALAGLRRYAARVKESEAAVDVEGLCQDLEPERDDCAVELVQLAWPLRDRAALLERLTTDRSVVHPGRDRDEDSDESSEEYDSFALLDRPVPQEAVGLTLADIPSVVARVYLGDNSASVEAYDDGRLESQRGRFVELAGHTIAPAQPKTEVQHKAALLDQVITLDWFLPPSADKADLIDLVRAERARRVREVWPRTRVHYLKGKTPRELAKSGQAHIALRAAVLRLELNHRFLRDPIDFDAFRAELGIVPEPEIDGAAVDIADVHLSRLHLVRLEALGNGQLLELLKRAQSTSMYLAHERVALEVLRRGIVPNESPLDHLRFYVQLAALAAERHDASAAFEWLAKGRESDPARSEAALAWDVEDFRLRSRLEEPAQWVPRMVETMDRFKGAPHASTYLTNALIGMGLIRLLPDPHDPNRRLMDTSLLQAVVERYGPRITTAAGELGISAARGGIWTPDSERAGAPSPIWTPGSSSPPTPGDAAAREKPKLIVPGRRRPCFPPLRPAGRIVAGKGRAGSMTGFGRAAAEYPGRQGITMSSPAESSRALSLVQAGWRHLEAQCPLAAWAAWQRATRLDPDNRAAKEALDVLARASDLPQVLRATHHLKSPRGESARRRWDAAFAAASADELEQIARLFEKLFAADTTDCEALFNEALAHAWLGNNSAARMQFEQYGALVAAANPDAASDAFMLARFLAHGEPPRFDSPVDWNYTLEIQSRDSAGHVSDRLRRDAHWVECRLALELGDVHAVSEGTQVFEWLDRPMPSADAIRSADELPRVLASVIITPGALRFSSTDRWRLRQIEWPLARALSGVTYIVERRSSPLPIRLMDAAAWSFRLPRAIDPEVSLRLSREAIELFYENEWARQPRYGLLPSSDDGPVSPLAASRVAHTSPHAALVHARLEALIETREQLAERPMVELPPTGYPFDRLRNRLGREPRDADLVDPTDVSCMSERQLEALETDHWELPLLCDAFRSAHGLLGRSAGVVGALAEEIIDRNGGALLRQEADALLDAAICRALVRDDPGQAIEYLDRYEAHARPDDAEPARRAFAVAWRAAIATEQSAWRAVNAPSHASDSASLEARAALACANRLLERGCVAQALALMLDVHEHGSDQEARALARRFLERDPLGE
jgi:tetratricopeptide (TPR) repeat protein